MDSGFAVILVIIVTVGWFIQQWKRKQDRLKQK